MGKVKEQGGECAENYEKLWKIGNNEQMRLRINTYCITGRLLNIGARIVQNGEHASVCENTQSVASLFIE